MATFVNSSAFNTIANQRPLSSASLMKPISSAPMGGMGSFSPQSLGTFNRAPMGMAPMIMRPPVMGDAPSPSGWPGTTLTPFPRSPSPIPMGARPPTQIGTPWSQTNSPPYITQQTTPPPSSTPNTPGGGGTCGSGNCAGTPHTPGTSNPGITTPTPSTSITHGPQGVTPGGGAAPTATPVPLGGNIDMSQLAGVMAAMIPASQSQSVFVGGQEQGQPLPWQAEHPFKGRDPGVQNGGNGNYLDLLRQGFWG